MNKLVWRKSLQRGTNPQKFQPVLITAGAKDDDSELF